jgi:hypothetical protein
LDVSQLQGSCSDFESGQFVPALWMTASEVDKTHECVELNHLPDKFSGDYRLGSSIAVYPPDSSSIIEI